ncbi:MAG: hypothetical protein JEZ14_13665 [Marinilabiliaceae bacterium]|nr:hypothetical protein [Marinilabiliaceae bacterium]
MSATKAIHVHLQEGNAQHYFEVMKTNFGGTTTENSYTLNTGPIRINMSSYDIMGELEMLISETT